VHDDRDLDFAIARAQRLFKLDCAIAGSFDAKRVRPSLQNYRLRERGFGHADAVAE
jgi:hypothetical protein